VVFSLARFAMIVQNVFDPEDADLQALRKTKDKRGQLDLF
jgi:hypothetical protein